MTGATPSRKPRRGDGRGRFKGRTLMLVRNVSLRRAALVCLVLLTWTHGCDGVAAAGTAGGDDGQFMSLDDVRPGMMGKAMSVFSGTRPEEFDVEILGVIRNWRPGGSLILGRASGARIEYLGIAAGMSGTPVYVGGKLVGAVAFAWPFAKEPIAGITPIQEMLDVRRRTEAERHGAGFQSRGSDGGAGFTPMSMDAGTGMKEIATPIMVAGFHPRVVELMKDELAQYNMVVAQSGSGVREEVDTLVAGGPLAAQLVCGDAVVSAIGTVTHVDGSRVLGFGHGLFSAGAVDVPMSGARIHAVLPSLLNSMKLGSVSGVVGTITGDGDAGVTGEIGRKADLVPVEVSVRSAGETVETRRFEVIRHRLFTPSLVAWTAASSVLTAAGSVGELTIRMNVSVELEKTGAEARAVKFQHLFFSVSSAAPLTEFLAGVVGAVMNNEFETARLAGVKCELAFVKEARVAEIEEVRVLADEARPGQDVTLVVKLRPHRGLAFTRRLSLRLPEGLTGERVEFKVCSAPEMGEWKRASTSRSPAPRSLDQLTRLIEASGRGNVVECAAYVSEREAVVQGETFPWPPESLSRVMNNSRRSGESSETSLAVVSETSWETEYAVEGCRTAWVRLGKPGIRR